MKNIKLLLLLLLATTTPALCMDDIRVESPTDGLLVDSVTKRRVG